MRSEIRVISSMASRRILQNLGARYIALRGQQVAVEAIGGVEALRRIREGEAIDLIALAIGVIVTLEQEGHLRAGSARPLARSPMAVAVRSGAPRPDISSEEAVKQAFLAAKTIGGSTGPSGVHLLALLKRWDIDAAKIVQAPPGVPVASFVARGEAEIGIQQLSELLNETGIDIVGVFPPAIQTMTTFAIGIGARTSQPEAAAAFQTYVTSAEAEAEIRAQGMEPA
jgi:molybdate transport system substrate-binding protein